MQTSTDVHHGNDETFPVSADHFSRGKGFYVLRIGPVTFFCRDRSELQRLGADVLRASHNPDELDR